MRCQRCGACCYSRAVVIRRGGRAVLKPADLLCPYLSFHEALAVCAVHDKQWFALTACHRSDGRDLAPGATGSHVCGLGKLLQSTPSLRDQLRRAPAASLEALEEVGPWDPEETT